MSDISSAHLDELKDKMEQAKVLYLKYLGAIEVVESILNPPKPEEPKKEPKLKK